MPARDQDHAGDPRGQLGHRGAARLSKPRRARFEEVAPILPVRDLDAALERYRRLGFEVSKADGAQRYGFAQRGAVSLHLSEWAEHDPLTTASSVYLYVADADAVRAEWAAAGVEGRFMPLEDTEYGLREFAFVDGDGTLHRIGSRLPKDGPAAPTAATRPGDATEREIAPGQREASERGFVIRTDGAARGNPGPASLGAVLIDASRPDALHPLAPPDASISEYLGRQTNNVAEYTGLVRALDLAAELGASEVDLLLDSKLIVEQLNGRWRAKDAKLIPLLIAAQQRLRALRRWSAAHVPRAQNSAADALANEAIDRALAGGPTRVVVRPGGAEPRAGAGDRTFDRFRLDREGDGG
ncbi:MAG TPA: reverse transcriptase-like protein [Candidatus Limnocylindrales bacterium]|nr:reverse transcriptase-like protein [Candidatus Limnocylindrales bacterium]